MGCPSPSRDPSLVESSSGEERASFSSGRASMLALGEPAASSPPASFGDGGLDPHCLAKESGASCTLTASAVIAALGAASYSLRMAVTSSPLRVLEARAKSHHQCIRQLGGNPSRDGGSNLFGGPETAPPQRQPSGGGDGVDRDDRGGGSDKLI